METQPDKVSATAGLKALLGVNGASKAETKTDAAISDATRGLKTMLGVPASSNPLVPPPASTSAADALLQLVVQSLGMTPSPQMPVAPFHPTQPRFNFTYVKEGDAEPMPPQGMNPYQTHPPFPMGQHPMGQHPMAMAMAQSIPMQQQQVQSIPIPVNQDSRRENGTSSSSSAKIVTQSSSIFATGTYEVCNE